MGNSLRKSSLAPTATVATEETDEVYLDPRSPTPDVARTPLNGKDNNKHKITKNTDLSKTFEICNTEDRLVHNNPILSAVIRKHLQSYDPRSPTQEFDRTPIVLSSNTQESNNNHDINHNGSVMFEGQDSMDPEVICENAAKNLSEDFLDSSVECSFKDSEPLGSSTASQDAIASEAFLEAKVLLETNFDFIPSEKSKECTEIHDFAEHTPIQKVIENKLTSKFKIIEVDPRSPSQGIERTPIVVHQKEVAISPDENVEDMSEESLVAALQSGIADLRRTPALSTDKGLLIYEDAATVLTPRRTQSAAKGTRTPLSCMKNKTEERSKSVITFDKKKPVSRIPKRVGSVPRVQSLQSSEEKSRSGGEVENTPPARHLDIWDKDSSVVL